MIITDVFSFFILNARNLSNNLQEPKFMQHYVYTSLCSNSESNTLKPDLNLIYTYQHVPVY